MRNDMRKWGEDQWTLNIVNRFRMMRIIIQRDLQMFVCNPTWPKTKNNCNVHFVCISSSPYSLSLIKLHCRTTPISKFFWCQLLHQLPQPLGPWTWSEHRILTPRVAGITTTTWAPHEWTCSLFDSRAHDQSCPRQGHPSGTFWRMVHRSWPFCRSLWWKRVRGCCFGGVSQAM